MKKQIHIGAELSLIPETIKDTLSGSEKGQKPLRGVVVYIHPKGRYITVEFTVRGNKVRESFTLPLLDGKKRA